MRFHKTAFNSVVQLLMVPLKKGGGTYYKSCNYFTFLQIWVEYPQIKSQSVHFKPIFIITVIWICFGQQINNTNFACVHIYMDLAVS